MFESCAFTLCVLPKNRMSSTVRIVLKCFIVFLFFIIYSLVMFRLIPHRKSFRSCVVCKVGAVLFVRISLNDINSRLIFITCSVIR